MSSSSSAHSDVPTRDLGPLNDFPLSRSHHLVDLRSLDGEFFAEGLARAEEAVLAFLEHQTAVAVPGIHGRLAGGIAPSCQYASLCALPLDVGLPVV